MFGDFNIFSARTYCLHRTGPFHLISTPLRNYFGPLSEFWPFHEHLLEHKNHFLSNTNPKATKHIYRGIFLQYKFSENQHLRHFFHIHVFLELHSHHIHIKLAYLKDSNAASHSVDSDIFQSSDSSICALQDLTLTFIS